MNPNIDQFAEAIKEAKKAAQEKSNVPDDGTCNMDTVVIDFSGWRQSQVDKLQGMAGVRIGEKMSGIWRGHRFVWFGSGHGQAARRTAMEEAAHKKLQELGIPSTVWYQMD